MHPVAVDEQHNTCLQQIYPEENILKRSSKLKKKFDYPTFTENFSRYFSQYCKATNVHGFQYVGERKRNILERVVWLAILVCVWYFCGYFVLRSYQKWKASPVIVTFATTETSIWKVPFPAVTICPEVKYDPAETNYSGILVQKMKQFNVSEQEMLTLHSLLHVCDQHNVSNFLDDFKHQDTIDFTEITEFVLASTFNDLTGWGSTWLKSKIKKEHITVILTELGVCYTFNLLNLNEILRYPEIFFNFNMLNETKASKWTLEDGYWDDKINYHTYPLRTFTAGINGGLNLQMFTDHKFIDPFCGDGLRGYKIMLHHPCELPNIDKNIQLPLDEDVKVVIKPRMLEVKDDLRKYTPEVRNCYYLNEKPLAHFKNYTQNNCINECLSNYTLKICGCVPFYMPRFVTSPICGTGKKECVERCKVKIGIERLTEEAVEKCDCRPSCSNLEYDLESSQSRWNWRKLYSSLMSTVGRTPFSLNIDFENDHLSRLSVFYKSVQFLTTERHQLYGYVDFFSNAGGLFGLLIGFSVTSAFEILYFVTLRLWCNLQKYGKCYWSGDDDLLVRS